MPRGTCFRIAKYKGDDVICTVTYVRGEHQAESKIKSLDARLNAEERAAGVYHWSERVAQRLCN